MNLTRHHGGMIILLTFAVAMLLTIIPLSDTLRALRPDWVALTLIFWCLALPYRVSVGSGFIAGLFLDVLTGTLLGQHALALSLIAYVCVRLHQRIRIYPIWQQALTVLLLLLLLFKPSSSYGASDVASDAQEQAAEPLPFGVDHIARQCVNLGIRDTNAIEE